MANWKGTPVPNSGYIEKVYFNTSLSVEEVVSILDTISYNEEIGMEVILGSELDENGNSNIIFISKTNNVWTIIVNFGDTLQETLFVASDALDFGFVGWNTNITYPLAINFNAVNELDGIAFGSQNNLLSSLFSTTPFVQEKVTLNSFLTGIADAIRTKNETTEPINAQDFATEILNIKTGDTETEDGIIGGTITKINNNRITKIKPYTFYACSKLTEANFPECTEIGNSAFYSCYSLTTISFPKCLSVNDSTFYACSKLTEANFPECTSMRGNAFTNCESLKEANFPECSVAYGYVFMRCYSLSKVNLPKLGYFSDGFFNNCSSLTEVDFPSCYTLSNTVFESCINLSKGSFPICSRIGNKTFYKCKKLEKVFLLSASVTLGTSVFYSTPMTDSSYLGYYGSIFVPNTALSKFQASTNWASISERITALPSEYDEMYIYGNEFYSSTITEIPEERKNVIRIYSSAFYTCSNLTEAIFPECSIIGNNAFASCTSLSIISFPKCLFIGSSAFMKCTSLTEAIFPECIGIEASAFSYCSTLTIASFPKCSYINGYYTFLSCAKLTEAYFPECIEIGPYAFQECYSLAKVNFTNCKTIRQGAFKSCASLKEVSFINCEFIGASAFGDCKKLESFYFNVKSVPILSSHDAFNYTPVYLSRYIGKFGSIYVPTSLYESFITAENWSRYSSRIVAMDFDD